MKKIVLMVMGLLFLSGCASGYQVNIDAPDSLPVGKPLVVTGTTTFGIGTPIDVVLYFQLTTTTEIKRKIVYVQSDKTFRAVFDTTGLKKGMYKVEVPVNGLGDSVTMRIIQLIDRSDDVVLSTPATQTFSGKMYIAGTIKGDENSGVQIEVLGPENLVVFGPRYVNTNYLGDFSAEVPVSESGEYEVSFTDAKGFIGTRTISITSQELPVVTSVTTATIFPRKSAHARSSQDSPAYFMVKTGSGPVTLFTSSSVDWVIEYIDEKGVLHRENSQGELNPERVEFMGNGKSIDVKVYPYKISAQSEVFLYAENANSVVVSPAVPASFAAILPSVPTVTQKSPLNPFAGLVAAALVLWLITVSRKN